MQRILKLCGLGVVGALLAGLQGYVAFWYLDYEGSFFSRIGLECSAVVAVAEIFLVAMVIAKVDELHSGMISNPHSRLGRSLRGDTEQAPPPPSRSAWDGGWEEPGEATDKMKSDQ